MLLKVGELAKHTGLTVRSGEHPYAKDAKEYRRSV
jgi:hypothetical protein